MAGLVARTSTISLRFGVTVTTLALLPTALAARSAIGAARRLAVRNDPVSA
ncbi:MAG: hypothetical protein ACRCY3_07500 [Sphingorhabdus sp.]